MLRRLYLSLPQGQRQFLKFSFVGVVGFLVDTGTLSILKRGFGFDPVIARVVSEFAIAMTVTWLLNRSLTFRDQRAGSVFREYLRFATANSIGNLLNFAVHSVLVENVGLFIRIPELGIVVGSAVGLIFNFTGSKYFVFRRT